MDGDERKVVSLFDRQPIESTVCEAELSEATKHAVAMLLDLAEGMQNGLYREFAIVLGSPDENGVLNGVATVTSPDACDHGIMFIGGLERMKHRIQSAMDEIDMEFLDED